MPAALPITDEVVEELLARVDHLGDLVGREHRPRGRRSRRPRTAGAPDRPLVPPLRNPRLDIAENDFLQSVTLPRTFVAMSQQDEVRAEVRGLARGQLGPRPRAGRVAHDARRLGLGVPDVAAGVVRPRAAGLGRRHRARGALRRGRGRPAGRRWHGLAAPTMLAHGSDDAASAACCRAHHHRRGHVVPALQRARQRLRPRRPDDPGRARRRRVGRQRAEGVEHERPPRRLRDAPRPHRLGRAQAPRHHATSCCRCTSPASRCARCGR